MFINTFIESLWLHNDEGKYIVYPEGDLENYSLNLESQFYGKYNKSLRNVHYVPYSKHKSIPQDVSIIIMDPQCYIDIMEKRENIIQEIKSICNNL